MSLRNAVRGHPRPHVDVWKDLLERKGLLAEASVLEEYGLSCEADVSRLDDTDLGALSSKLRPLQANLLRKWVQGLATGGNRSLTAAAVNSTEPAQEKGDSERRDKHEMELESEGQPEDEDQEEDEEDDEDPADAEGEQEGDEDVLFVGEMSVQDEKEDATRAASDEAAPAAKKSKPSPLSADQQAFVAQFKPPASKIQAKERKISVCWVKGKKSTKKQGGRVADVSVVTLAKRPEQFLVQFLSVMGGQLWCGACYTNVGSATQSVRQHVKGMEHVKKVQIKTAGGERGTRILQSIAEYKETVKADTGGQEPVGFERVPENVQVARAEMLQELMAAGIEVSRARLSGSLACSMPLLERISKDPSGTTLSWQCSLSTTNAMCEASGLGLMSLLLIFRFC